MKASEIRSMTSEALQTELEGAYRELFNLRFRRATQQLNDTSVLKDARRNVARIKTILRERELAQSAAK